MIEVERTFEQRRQRAEDEFHKRLRSFMRKYNIDVNQLNEIGVLTQLDYIAEARNQMVLWNNRWCEERNMND